MGRALTLDPVALLLPRRSFLLTNAALLAAAPFSEEELARGLKQPTEDHPQIMIPDKLQLKPEVEGLVQLKNPSAPPNPSDTLYLLISSRSSGSGNGDASVGPPLGGAAVPVARLRFPFQFVLKADNAFPGQRRALEEALVQGDLLVTARVCGRSDDGSDNTKAATSATTSPLSCPSSLQGAAVARLLQLEQGPVRVPVTLILNDPSASAGKGR